jgi:hypothetical protein
MELVEELVTVLVRMLEGKSVHALVLQLEVGLELVLVVQSAKGLVSWLVKVLVVQSDATLVKKLE